VGEASGDHERGGVFAFRVPIDARGLSGKQGNGSPETSPTPGLAVLPPALTNRGTATQPPSVTFAPLRDAPRAHRHCISITW
jgi:hypothetical protein